MLKHSWLFLLVLACSAIIFGCGGDDDPGAPAPTVDPEVNDYMDTLPTWDEFSPPMLTADVPTDTSTSCLDQIEDVRYLCVETPMSLTDTPQEVVTFDAGGGFLWPGALIQGRSHAGGVGTMLELPIRQRAPVTISINLLTQNNRRTIADPDLASVRSAVGELIEAAELAGHQAGSNIHYKRTEAHTFEQMSLKLGLTVKYMGANVRSDLEFASSTETNTVAAYFVQNMFTVNMVPPQTPGAVFSSEFTEEQLQQQIDLGRIGPNNLPVYVSQVVYGRMLVMTMTSNHSTRDMMASLKGSYGAVSAGAQYTGDQVWSDSEFTVTSVGGGDTGVLGLLTTGNMADYFAAETALTEAVPISYTLRNLSDDSVASVAATTAYTQRVCTDFQIFLLDSESQWRDAVQGEVGDQIYTFVPNAGNIGTSEERDAPTGNNQAIGPTLTFLGANTGYPFDFVIDKSMQPGSFTYNDNDDDFWGDHRFDGCPYPLLSPGDMHDYEDDDFAVIITRVDEGLAVSGIAVHVGHNSLNDTEYLEVVNPQNVLLEIFDHEDPLPNNGSGYAFMGVASPVSLKKIFFNEDMGGDDICFQNIWISVRELPDETEE